MRWIVLVVATLLLAKEPIIPIPAKISYDKEKAALGKTLFFDPNLSRDRSISCSSCHDFDHAGADPRAVSIGVYGRKGRLNAPPVFNAVFNFRQFWNGRAKDLKEQAKGPLFNPIEMGMDKKLLLERLDANEFYKRAFWRLYKRAPSIEDLIDAIVEYEKSLVTPNAKFDRYLKGETKLTKKELQGYLLFKELGCITCHNGVNIGGNSFQKMGLLHPYPHTLGDRYEVTHDPRDRGVYKVPTLRNIALTAPYFHDGSAKTLKEAIKKIGYYNLGIDLEEEEIEKIEAFLKTLTAKIEP